MATTIAAQLQAIKSFVQGDTESQKRPYTRPSILFDPKEASDIDIETIFTTALSGLELLIKTDERYANYKNTLFSHKSRDLDREVMNIDENNNINLSISSYLRLLSGHLNLPASLKTLEFLIRRYKIHVYNVDDLVLCALPYHDTHVFVRIVQILDLGNKRWGFLEGVKVSGAPPPRKVIVQQCLRDMGVLDALCDYAMPVKKFQHSRTMISFCTAVIIESVGATPTLDDGIVKRILPFVFGCLKPVPGGGPDYEAGAMMIVGLLASRTALAPKLISNFIFFISRVAQLHAKELGDLPWLRMSLMVIINLVQTQSVPVFPKKALDVLKEIRDLPGVLFGLSKEFNIKKFLSIYLEGLVEYSSSDDSTRFALISTIETGPMKEYAVNVVLKVLATCTKSPETAKDSDLLESGIWAKQILIAVNKHYPSELNGAVCKFLENSRRHSKQGDSILEALSMMFDGNSDMPLEISKSKVWLSLEHPKAEVRRATLSNLAASGFLKDRAVDSKNSLNVQEAILRRLHDEDMGVVKAALSLEGLSWTIDPASLFQAFQNILSRSLGILAASTSHVKAQACDVAIICLDYTLNFVQNHSEYTKAFTTMIFPLLLVLPKTWKLNQRLLEYVKEIQWPFYNYLPSSHDLQSIMQVEKLEASSVASINTKIISALSENFMERHEEYMPWLIECCNSFEQSKTLFFLIILQSFRIQKEDAGKVSKLFQTCFPILKQEWCAVESKDGVIPVEKQWNSGRMMDVFNEVIMGQSTNTGFGTLSANLLLSIYWNFLKEVPTTGLHSSQADGEWLQLLQDLFVFFAMSPSKQVFREHLDFIVMHASISPASFLSRYFTEEGFPIPVQVESLHLFAHMCSASSLSNEDVVNNTSHLQLLLHVPSILVPLSSSVQELRMAAVDCIEGLCKVWRCSSISFQKSGNALLPDHIIWTHVFGEFLELIYQQKQLIFSDVNFLRSLLASMLSGSSGENLLVPRNFDKRFDPTTRDAIVCFILKSTLKLSSFGKLMILSLLEGLGASIFNLEEFNLLLSDLLERRNGFHLGHDKSQQELVKNEIQILCLLLKCCVSLSSSSAIGDSVAAHIFKALNVGVILVEDPAIILPCITVLQKLNHALYESLGMEVQDGLFRHLVILFRHDNGDIQNAAREALLRIHVGCSTISRHLDLINALDNSRISSLGRTKRKKPAKSRDLDHGSDLLIEEEKVFFLSSLLDVLLLKKDIGDRGALIEPLFNLLGKTISGEWLGFVDQDEQKSKYSTQPFDGAPCFIQQTILSILEDITASFADDLPVKNDILKKINVDLLIECGRFTKDLTTRNHVFSLISSIAKVNPGQVLDHIVDIFTVMGESAITQSDSYSQRVLADLISAVVPSWQSRTDSTEKLLQVFINVLPEVSEHRRLDLMICLLRALGVKNSLGPLLVLLFRSLVQRSCSDNYINGDSSAYLSSASHRDWEYIFAAQLCEQYSCTLWLPSLVLFLKQLGMDDYCPVRVAELLLAMRFIVHKLQDTELVFKLESGQDQDDLQGRLRELMGQAVLNWQSLDVRGKELNLPSGVRKELKESTHGLLRNIVKFMIPSTYFKAFTLLLKHEDGNVRKKTLGLLCETLKNSGMVQKKSKGAIKAKMDLGTNFGLAMDDAAWESFNEMCLEIVHLIDSPIDDSVKLGAISAVEVLTNKFPSYTSIFSTFLSSVTRHIGSDSVAVSSGCLRSMGALIKALGARALSELPHIMEQVLKKAGCFSSEEKSKSGKNTSLSGISSGKESLSFSILVTFEAVVETFGGFLNPYLEDIIGVMVLQPGFTSETDQKVKLKAAAVRRLLTDKISVRLILAPLLKIYPEAVDKGESSVSIVFEMLSSMIGNMDRSSVRSYHTKIFEQCLQALDLRRQCPQSVKHIVVVEENVINSIVSLTMKLTETMFQPLFIHMLDWVESEETRSETYNFDRNISFYRLVNKLIEHQRSLFVPYFKHLLQSCTRYLTDDRDLESISTRKKKKAKVHESDGQKKPLSPQQWHLRALIISALHKCCLYDAGNLKFLDTSNFQILLKPIVLQIIEDPPASLEQLPDMPTTTEVDESLVSCLGQMAVTAGSDLLWKPLNHEVLMQTRSEKVRARILGLRVVKYMLEHLKDEYLVLLPETIPFLGELLEDEDLSVKSLAQQIFKDMETLSGENLRQHL